MNYETVRKYDFNFDCNLDTLLDNGFVLNESSETAIYFEELHDGVSILITCSIFADSVIQAEYNIIDQRDDMNLYNNFYKALQNNFDGISSNNHRLKKVIHEFNSRMDTLVLLGIFKMAKPITFKPKALTKRLDI